LANTADFVEYVRLGDGLPNIADLATAFSTNDDIEARVSDAWRLFLYLTNSRKPVVSGAFTEHGVGRMAEMLQLFRHNRADLIALPMSIFTITATGMFHYGEESCQNLLDCIEAGIPVEIVPVTLMGLIAPVSLMGATVFHTVDTLAEAERLLALFSPDQHIMPPATMTIEYAVDYARRNLSKRSG